ncbi:GNAT family N-acetyltransferase [Aliihoeflea sp. 40Bstr573]|uniref:GNAT family N-acetyltransferase n=1 Tax=Aliihoeflea sp. 40Bstr573 TaxID=2696467 RepID=UPI00209503C5|nr:N-acetyltransferase [Aliihoeflea sp. 40Bstr573]MCO6386572.1 GNAT family N-acetyltransferase [Aliihoeflea sp. 40Bstr573]
MEFQQDNVAPVAQFTIAVETAADICARDALLDRAMGPRWKKKSSEKLRRGRLPAEGLAFVARDAAGDVVGTVRLWDVAFDGTGAEPPLYIPPHKGEGGHPRCAPPVGSSSGEVVDGTLATPSAMWGEGGGRLAATRPHRALLLGPLAVDLQVKSGGIGSALMRHAIDEAKRFGHGAILLVGDAPYYARFGFSAERTGELAMPGPYERSRFLALELTDGALDGASGTLVAAGRKLVRERLRAVA